MNSVTSIQKSHMQDSSCWHSKGDFCRSQTQAQSLSRPWQHLQLLENRELCGGCRCPLLQLQMDDKGDREAGIQANSGLLIYHLHFPRHGTSQARNLRHAQLLCCWLPRMKVIRATPSLPHPSPAGIPSHKFRNSQNRPLTCSCNSGAGTLEQREPQAGLQTSAS